MVKSFYLFCGCGAKLTSSCSRWNFCFFRKASWTLSCWCGSVSLFLCNSRPQRHRVKWIIVIECMKRMIRKLFNISFRWRVWAFYWICDGRKLYRSRNRYNRDSSDNYMCCFSAIISKENSSKYLYSLLLCFCYQEIRIDNIQGKRRWYLVLTLWIVSSKLCCGPPPFIWNGLSLSAAVCKYEGVKKKSKPEMRNRNC